MVLGGSEEVPNTSLGETTSTVADATPTDARTHRGGERAVRGSRIRRLSDNCYLLFLCLSCLCNCGELAYKLFHNQYISGLCPARDIAGENLLVTNKSDLAAGETVTSLTFLFLLLIEG